MWETLETTVVYLKDLIAAKKQEQLEAQTDNDGSGDVAMTASSSASSSLDHEIHQLQSEVDAILVVVFDGFQRVVADHKRTAAADGAEYQDNWFASALARMKALGRRFRVDLERVLDQLQRDVFPPSADRDAAQVFALVRDCYRTR